MSYFYLRIQGKKKKKKQPHVKKIVKLFKIAFQAITPGQEFLCTFEKAESQGKYKQSNTEN